MENVSQSPMLQTLASSFIAVAALFLKGSSFQKFFQNSSLGASGEVISPHQEDVLDASDELTPSCFPFPGVSSASLIRGWLSRQEGEFNFINRQLTIVPRPPFTKRALFTALSRPQSWSPSEGSRPDVGAAVWSAPGWADAVRGTGRPGLR